MNITLIRSETKVFIANTIRIILIALLTAAIMLIVSNTGGTPNAYVHLIYIPIFLSAYYWGIVGGVSVAIVGGILVSPLVLSHTSREAIPQSDFWQSRLLILILVGFVAGYLFRRVYHLNKKANELLIVSPLTGTYNIIKLISDLREKTENRENFTIVSIKLTNFEAISKYIEDSVAKNFLNEFIKELSKNFGKDSIYSLGYDEINLILSSGWSKLETLKQIIEKHSTTFKKDDLSVKVFLKVGVYEYIGTDESAMEVYNKARIASEQGNTQETDIYFYDKGFNLNRQELLEISSSLLDSIENSELYLVYQPKINLADNRICGVEVLTRWDRKDKKAVAPNVFIKLAEEIGFIKEISKFVLENSYNQIVEWKNRGIELDFSINFTANELLDDHFIEWEKRLTECEHNVKDKLKIEITERVIWQNTDKIIKKINKLRAKGIRISIDDYGTGFNSLIMAAQFSYDQIKIDKYFIDHINDLEIRLLIVEMIEHAHAFGREVVAEGVETLEQLIILKELGCDIVQGYYYSKPIRPEEFEEYYKSFQKRIHQTTPTLQ
jgi:EAL domain-containing protein (putative c-di-GMP-specific phosphodiesterase class I)/GGDEF domain-containing protein